MFKLFISNIDFNVTQEQLTNFLDEFAPTYEVRLPRKPPLKIENQGIAFVSVLKLKDAFKIINRAHNQILGERKLKISWDKKSQPEDIFNKRKRQPGHFGG